jgi:hypothetical protein
MLNLVIAGVCTVVALYFATVMLVDYTREQGTIWERLLAAGRYSVTVLWNRFVILVGTGTAAVASITADAGYPELADHLKELFTPKVVLGIMVGMSVVSILARNRTLNKD